MEGVVALSRPRWRLAGAAAVLVLAAGAVVAGTLLPDGGAARRPGTPGSVTVAAALPGGRGTLSLTAQWTSVKGPGHPVQLGGFSAQFSTCRRGGFLDLKKHCFGLANPFLRVLGVTPRGVTVSRFTTRIVLDNSAYGHRTGWIVPIERGAGTLYRLAAKDDLIVQLWAINTRIDKPHKIGQIRG
jgi:hypothetical protein